MLDIPEDEWDAKDTTSDPNMVLRVSRTPPADVRLNIKLIYNQDWVQSSSNGDVDVAKQRAIDVLQKAEDLYSSPGNGLGTRITFNRVGGSKLIYCPENIFKVSKFIELYRKFEWTVLVICLSFLIEPEYDPTGNYKATLRNLLVSPEIRDRIDNSISSTHVYVFLTGHDEDDNVVGIGWGGMACRKQPFGT